MRLADRTQRYNYVATMDTTNIIKENKAISVFVFEYFPQKNVNMLQLLSEALEKNTFVPVYGNCRFGYDAYSSGNVQFQKRDRIDR